ncbi:NAD(P)/FAD-dependent oxidoreductase [bacterium]|nr:NAD(P)/FAD-dependent oxidoreductase [bacterium]
MHKSINIPDSDLPRIVVIGGGFAGLTFCQKINTKYYQVVLLDRHNFHTFQPLLYQVATAGLEPSSISGPLRKLFKNKSNFYFRVGAVEKIEPENNLVRTSLGKLSYDYLVVANGAKTNYFGHEENYEGAFPLKQTAQALSLRNSTLRCFEDALLVSDSTEKQALLNFVVVGGGPTGVEVSGAFSELKNNVLPKDYPELDFSKMKVYLIEGSNRLLNGMSNKSHEDAIKALKEMGVEVLLETRVNSYKNELATLSNGTEIPTKTLVWAAGVTGNLINGLEPFAAAPANRVKVDRYNLIEGTQNIYALGDIALMATENHPKGHPQLAPVAIQQAELLARNLMHIGTNKKPTPFKYTDKGSMATIGRNKAVVDLPGNVHFKGIFAWFVWMFVHLMSIIGFRNRVVILFNWIWNYFTYDRSIRLILKASK